MARLIIILSLLVVVYSSSGQSRTGSASSGCCTSKYSAEQRDTLGLYKLGAEYKRLKAARCERCNASTGDFFGILNSLGDRLKGKTEKEVRKIMGRPDEKWSDTCVYFWRGRHDYLFFNFPGGRGVAQWYHAWE